MLALCLYLLSARACLVAAVALSLTAAVMLGLLLRSHAAVGRELDHDREGEA